MIMSFGDFFLQSNNGKKIGLNFKGKLKREDFAGNQKLLKIFDYFDSDKSGVIENLTKDGKNEIFNIFAHIKQTAELREGEGNTVVDSQEAISLTSFVKNLKGVTANELFEFLKIAEEKKNVVEKETVEVSSDGTKTVVSTLQDGSVETDVFYPSGELKLRVTETPITEDFTKGEKITTFDSEIVEKKGGNGKKEELSLVRGAKEGRIILKNDSAKYLSEKYNKEVASAYYKNGVMELRDKNDKPVMRVAVDISPKVEQELREFVGKHLKESSENVLQLAKTAGWIDKLGIDLQDISINKAKLTLSILNPALLLTALEANGKEKLEGYLNQLRENVKNGELLESGATTKGAFDSRFERMTGHSEVNFLQIERLRQTADKYNNVQGLNQRIVLLNQGIKEVKQLYQNYRAQKQGVPNSGKLNSNFDGKILEILTQFFNGDEDVAKALIQTISKGITSKDDLFRKFNAVLTTIKQKASETKSDLLKGESEEELKARYENEYKAMYGQDAVFKAEELITHGKETGGMIQIGMMTAAQMLLAAATMGTGNAALMALQSNALIGFLSTVGTDYALSLSNILSSERGFTAEAQEELHQRTLGTAEFIGFGMVAANPLSRAVGKYASKLFASDAEKVLEGAFAQEVKAGTNAVTRTTTGALTKTTLSLESALEWMVVKGSEFGTEILSFSGFELLQQDEEFNEVVKGQASTLTKLKVMNAALQVMLGSFVRNQALRGQSKLVVKECNKMLKDMGIEGGKLTENKRPGGSNYTLEINGETKTFKDIKELQANFMSVLAENYIKTRQIPDEIKNLDNDALVSEFTQLIQKQDALTESENARLVDLYQELQNRGLGVNDGVNDKVKNNPTPKSKISTLPQREGEGTTSSNTVPSPLTPSPREGNGSMTAQRYTKPITPYTEAGNKIHELKSSKPEENPQLIAEIKADIEALRKTDPQKADELQIVLEMFTNPTVVSEVTDAQIDAVVNYLNDHYSHLEGYLNEQVGEIGINDPKYGRFGHRIKGEASTHDKVANFIKDAIKEEQKAKEKGEEYTPKTLLSAFKDVRDKYACRTVFELGDFTKHPEVKVLIAQAKTLASEGKPELAAAKMHEAEFKAAELQSEPVRLQILEAMRRAKEEGKDLKAVRISNYYSENGIPIFTPEQMESLKLEAAQMGIDVEFIRLAKEIDPKATTEFVDGASTKKQPSGYTALQINFETKTGEVIEWQYRGELVNEFAEAEHLPYDLRTGKHPWKQIPELKALYEPIADLLQEKVMPKYAYKQLNRYFTDYYTHLRRLELGFESEEPRLSDYEKWTAKDENGVEQRYSFKFDSRLEAKNLMELHHFAEGIKDGLITPERALEEFNMKVFNQTKIKNSEKLSYEQRIKNLANQEKEAVGKDFSLDLSSIKNEDLLSFLEEELVEWDDPEPISNIIKLAKNLESFQKGGFEALDEKAQKAYEIPYYWGASIKDRLTEARKTEDTKQREKALAGIKMHIYSHILITSEVRDNIQFRNLVKEKFIQPNIPKEYYNAINELEELTGKQVCMIHDFGPKKDGIINLRIDNVEAWLSMSDKVKNFYKKNADKLLVEYNMLSKNLVKEYEKLSESELEVYVKRGGIDYQHSAGETPKEIVTMDEGKLNRIKELSQRWKTSEGLQYSTSQICKLLDEFSTEEIEIIEKRQLYNLHTEIYSYLEPKYLRILTNLNEQEWQYLHNKGFISSDNELQLPFIKIENDHYGNIQRHDKTLEQFMNSINNLKNGSKIAENIQELGYSPLEALAQVGSLIKDLNETEVKELQEFNWNAALTKYNNISKMMKANPEKYISGQFLSIKSIYELFSKEVLSQKYEYKKDLQNAVRNFFYENDIAHCEFYSDFQQKLSQEIRSNTIDVKQAKEILKSFFEKKVFSEEMSKDTSMPEKIMSDAVNEFLNLNEKRLTRLCAFMDKEGLETLLRKRFSDVEEYLDTLDEFNYADLKLLKDLSCSYNLSGKPFLPTQKIEFIDLISGYRAFGLDMSKMHQMVKEQKVDTAKLHKDLFMQIMKKIGMSAEEVNSIPNEKLMTWDLKYMHLLAKEMAGDFVNLDDTMHRSTKAGDNAFADIIRNANLNDFKLYIQDIKNIYGQTNAKTKDEYKENGLNNNIWVNPPQELNVHFESTDKDTRILINLSSKLLKDVNILRQNNALKGIIDKQFSQCIKDGEFIIPTECQTSAVKLKGFIDNLLRTLEPVKTRALSNLNNPQRSEIARRNLSTIQSIESTMINAESYKDLKASKSYNLTIKMWDRNPQHDLFQGNYSTCCIGMGGGNGSAQPHYLLNTSCNMIEILDEATGRTVGNALCYFAKNAEGKPIFILDNVEINNSIKFTEETGKSFRNAIIQYAANISKAVTRQDNTEIYMGASYNDIPTSDLPVYNNKISFIGKFDCEELYLDVYSGWINTNELDGQRKLLRLK